MAATELMHSIRAMRPEDQAVAMAVAVLSHRLQKLSSDERRDLLSLVKELAIATTDEDRHEITQTMLEIFESRPTGIEQLEFSSEGNNAAVQRWRDFVAKRVREAREESKMTQEQLAHSSGLPQSHISRIENAKLSPSRATIEKIAKAVNKSVADFDHEAERADE